MIETEPGSYSLCLDAGSTAVDDAIGQLGHEPNGYFWEGVVRWLLANDDEARPLGGRFDFDPEGGMFVAYAATRRRCSLLVRSLRRWPMMSTQ